MERMPGRPSDCAALRLDAAQDLEREPVAPVVVVGVQDRSPVLRQVHLDHEQPRQERVEPGLGELLDVFRQVARPEDARRGGRSEAGLLQVHEQRLPPRLRQALRNELGRQDVDGVDQRLRPNYTQEASPPGPSWSRSSGVACRVWTDSTRLATVYPCAASISVTLSSRVIGRKTGGADDTNRPRPRRTGTAPSLSSSLSASRTVVRPTR